jgi:hypothetical protein
LCNNVNNFVLIGLQQIHTEIHTDGRTDGRTDIHSVLFIRKKIVKF